MTKADLLNKLENYPDDIELNFKVFCDFQDDDNGCGIFPTSGNIESINWGVGYSVEIKIEV